MVKRYLGAALVAFVLGCVGPLTVGAAQAAEEPDDAPSLLGSVTGTLGSLTSGNAGAEPDVDGPELEPGGQEPAPEPGEPAPAPSGPEPAEPDAPGAAPAPDTNGSGVLGAVTTTVNRLADAPRNLLTDVADDAPTPEAQTPDIPVQPEAPEPPADSPPPPDKPDKPESPDKPETPDNAESPASTDTPAGPPANATPALLDVNQSITELEQTAAAPAPQSITLPDIAEPERTQSQRPRQDVPAFLDPTEATGDYPAEQDKSAARPPQDVRAEAISLRHVTQTPFVLAIALLTAVGVVTVRRVIAVK